jgi:riboflavin synthase
MFTGIIEEIGAVVDVNDSGDFRKFRFRARQVLEDVRIGSSIAVNGVCLTVTGRDDNSFTVDVVHETLSRTSLKTAAVGTVVNLELPMRADGRFDGHIVQGHVDGVGRIASFNENGDNRTLTVEFPAAAARYIVEKGSIAIDGISLTVASVTASSFEIAIIPHTFQNTNLAKAQAGDLVNLEFDIVAKYVEKMLVRTPDR